MHVGKYIKKLKPKIENNNMWISLKRKDLKGVLKELKKLGVHRISSISGTDVGKDLEVVYHFVHKNMTINIRIPVDKKEHTIETITDIYPGSNLFERELSEMLGIHIKGHPNPKRLFLAHDSPRMPLRKS
jgi:NADH:ubiquinone oxidoreductase subunit C